MSNSENKSMVCQKNMNVTEHSFKKDFYDWVNHKWLNDPNNAIPNDYSRWGGFMKLHDDGLKKQIQLVKDIALTESKNNNNHDENLISCVWNVSMNRFKKWNDSSTCSNDDYSCILKGLERQQTLLGEYNPQNLAKYIGYAQMNGIRTFMTFDKECDFEDSNNVKLDVSGCGLSLPSRDYYFDEKFTEQRNHFKKHLQNVYDIMTNNGIELIDGFVENVFNFEMLLSMIKMKDEQSRDYDKYYTNTSLIEFYSCANQLNSHPDKENNYLDEPDTNNNLTANLNGAQLKDFKMKGSDRQNMELFMENLYEFMGLRTMMKTNYEKNYKSCDQDNYDKMIVFDGDYFKRLMRILFCDRNEDLVKAFLQYKAISTMSSYCTKELNEEYFDFYSRKLSGQKEQKSDEKRSISVVNNWAGEVLGKVYIQQYFSQNSKLKLEAMIQRVIGIMKISLQNNDWLTDETKEKALVKLSKFRVKIGFPDKWKDYSNLRFNVTDSMSDLMRKVSRFEYQTEFLNKLNSLKDIHEWHMNPQTVNAYFSPTHNEIVFPAAILQPPFFHENDETIDFEMTDEEIKMCKEYNIDMSIPVNYGGIGAVIAHEITHGYDDQGRKFDGDGNLKNWWSDNDTKLFSSKTKTMADQTEFFKYNDVQDDGKVNVHKMNAHLTMGENLADLGGLSLGMKAMIEHLENNCKTNDVKKCVLRLFFKSWANVWKSNAKKESIIERLSTDPHAPESFRGNMVRNFSEFYEAFDVSVDDEIYLPSNKRVRMW